MSKLKEILGSVDKKLWIYLGVILAIALIGIIVSVITYNINNSNLSYTDIEKKLENAARKYYADNSNLLPKKDGGEVTIRDGKLSDEGYMKPMEKMIKDASCNGKVVVTLNNKKYKYTPYLDCGKEYQTKEMYKRIKEEKIVEEGSGLYQNDTEYVYRGEEVNNYLKFDNKIFRILKVNEDNSIKLILDDSYTELEYTWDNRYNEEADYGYGYNVYEKSRLKEELDSVYKKDDFLTETGKEDLVPMNLCIGARGENESKTEKEIECSKTLDNQYIGTITAYEYMRASIDEKCTSALSQSCKNYNYLVSDFSYWTLTADSVSSYNAYYVYGSLNETETSDRSSIRPVITISSDVMYKSGNGSVEHPFVVR